MKHLVVTPYHNEEEVIEGILESVINQTMIPVQWILVNDNSTDNSYGIVEKYVENFDWIININSSLSFIERQEGAKIITLVLEGLKNENIRDYDIFTKLDSDLKFGKDYFEIIVNEFKNNINLALCGGKIYSSIEGEYIDEKKAKYHVRGANKSYRTTALLETNCLRPLMGWDGLDEMILMYYGFETKLLDIPVYQQRMTRERFNETKFQYENAYGKYKLGHSLTLAIIRAIKRGSQKPYFLKGFAYLAGHLHALINKEEIVIESELVRFINKFHYKRLLKIK